MPAIYETVEEEVMKEISADTGIPYSVVKDIIINGQSGFTKHIMESGGYNSVRWPRFGTFKLKHKYMLIRKHMQGMHPVYKKIFKNVVNSGKLFKDKEE